MTVRELINVLLDCPMDKPVKLEYPSDAEGRYEYNYAEYKQTDRLLFANNGSEVVIGADR